MSSELNILFTCAGRRVALLEAFSRAMKELDVAGRLVAADVTEASAAFQAADVGVIVPRADTIEYVPSLLEICADRKIGLVIPLTDLDLASLARQSDKFADIGAEVMVSPAKTIQICRDKTRTNEFLDRIGLETIGTCTLPEFRENPFFPCFIKPICGSASIGTAVLGSRAELDAHLAAHGNRMLLQEYVPGSEYTLDIFRTKAGRVESVVPRQRLSIRAGEVEKGLTVHDEDLIRAGVLLGENLDGFWGVVNAQCRRPAGEKARFFEINPRFGGGAPLSIAAGANLPRYVLEDVLGMPVTARLGEFRPNLLMLRYDQAVYVGAESPTDLPGFDIPRSR